LEWRKLWAVPVSPEQVGFAHATQAVRIRRRVLAKGKLSEETAYAITALEPLQEPAANGKRLLQVGRAHWSIENGNHYIRDRSYDEDRSPVRHPNAARILATLRSTAAFLCHLNVHKPRSVHQATVPALNRFCTAHRNAVIRWIMDKPPL